VVYTLSPLKRSNARKKRAEYHGDDDVPPYRLLAVSVSSGREVGSREGDAEVAPGHGLALLSEVDDRVANEGKNVLRRGSVRG
jgi:hypothetical protein